MRRLSDAETGVFAYGYIHKCTFILICPMKETGARAEKRRGKWRKINVKGCLSAGKDEVTGSLKRKKAFDSIGEYR